MLTFQFPFFLPVLYFLFFFIFFYFYTVGSYVVYRLPHTQLYVETE